MRLQIYRAIRGCSCSVMPTIQTTGIDPKTREDLAGDWSKWRCEALRGESYSLSHGKAKATEGSYCQSQSCSHAFVHFPLQHLWSTMHHKDWPNHSHEESQELVQDRSSYIVPTGDSILTHTSIPAVPSVQWCATSRVTTNKILLASDNGWLVGFTVLKDDLRQTNRWTLIIDNNFDETALCRCWQIVHAAL